MTVVFPLLLGCGLTAFGPSVALFYTVVSKRAQLVIVALSGAFFWLTAILLSALVWTMIPPLKSYYGVIVPVGVIIQEAMRYGLYVTYSKSEQAIQAVATPNAALPLNLLTSALAAGLGFGTMQGVIMYGSVLAASTGPGVLFVDACPHMPLVMLSAINCLCFIVMNVTLMLVAFGAYRDNNRQRVMTVFLIHLVCSLVTVINTVDNGCAASLPLLVIIVTGTTAFFAMKSDGFPQN